MITDAHFTALQEVRNAAQDLSITCTKIAGAAAFMHQAFDREVSPRLSPAESALVRKLRSVK